MANQYFIVPTTVFMSKELTPTDRLVWVALCSFAHWNDDRTQGSKCFPSLATLEERTGHWRNTIIKSLKKLEAMGLISKITGNASNSNNYILYAGDNRCGGSLGEPAHRVNQFNGCTSSMIEPVQPLHIPSSMIELPQFNDYVTPVQSLHSNNTNNNTNINTNTNTIGERELPRLSEDALPPPPSEDTTASPKTKDGVRSDNFKTSKKAQKEAHIKQMNLVFDDLWRQYPNRQGEKAAREVFVRLFPFGLAEEEYATTLNRIHTRLESIIYAVEAGERDTRYIPLLKNWLKDEDFNHD